MSTIDDKTIIALPPTVDGRVELHKVPDIKQGKGTSDKGTTGAAIAQSIGEAFLQIMKNINKDDDGRRKFTQGMVTTLQETFSQYNWICIHPSHEKSFDGKEGEDWGKGHGDFDLKIGGKVGYEIYYCRSGIFALHGDGGYLNWAWTGYITAKSDDGRIIMFRRP